MTDSSFQLKGSVVTTILLEIHEFNQTSILEQLAEKVEKVPHFFSQAPIIVDLTKLRIGTTAQSLNALIQQVNALGLKVIGWRCDTNNQPLWHAEIMSPLLPVSKTKAIQMPEPKIQAESKDVVIKTVIEERRIAQPTKVIDKPIRSGQQVYAEGDLIILAQVSAGAEVLADGNIHVYGALRGRALAGVKGDVNARIFCKSLEAELVSVAGNFMLSDALQKNIWKESAQVLLVDDSLEVVAL
ncbi:septum site-determining protein MinC [Marinomonas epiphytica]